MDSTPQSEIRNPQSNIPVSVLIVDDTPANLTALAAALAGMDVEITTAASGMEALRQLLAQDFAVVLLDVNMPIMDGFETATMIRRRPRSEHLPILFITAERLSDDARLQGYGLGAVDYILSPVLPQILRAKVAVFADLYRLREQVVRQNLMLEEQVEKRTAALRESETKYRLLIENLQEGVWMIDKDANTSFVNLRMAQMLGYSVEEMQGRHLFSFMDERGKEIATRNLERRKQRIREQHDFELLRKDGSRIYTSMAASPILDQAGNYAGALAGVTDITERKQAEAELNKHQQLLRELEARNLALREAELKHIAREIHDELGQILTALRLDVALVNLRFGEQNAPLLAKTQEMVALLDQAARCVHDIVSNLRPAVLDIGLVPAIKWLCDEHAARTGSSCVVLTAEEHIDLDEAHAVAVFRIVQELLTNAARHADASSVTITLTRHAGDLHVVVRDNGKGFDPASVATKKSFGLLGIRERAIALGGEVDLVSAPNQGTMVTLTVPAKPNGDNE